MVSSELNAGLLRHWIAYRRIRLSRKVLDPESYKYAGRGASLLDADQLRIENLAIT